MVEQYKEGTRSNKYIFIKCLFYCFYFHDLLYFIILVYSLKISKLEINYHNEWSPIIFYPILQNNMVKLSQIFIQLRFIKYEFMRQLLDFLLHT